MLTVARFAVGFAAFYWLAQRLGWFLDDGRAAAMTLGALFLASVVTTKGQSPLSSAIGVAAGACTAMALVLFRRGPGTIFPLALLVGGLMIIAFSVAGAYTGRLARRH